MNDREIGKTNLKYLWRVLLLLYEMFIVIF